MHGVAVDTLAHVEGKSNKENDECGMMSDEYSCAMRNNGREAVNSSLIIAAFINASCSL
jgi:hypothetical protein